MKETDLAIKVIDWLESQHWDVYQEVDALGSVADIVAVQNKLVWVIECKLSLSLDLIAQAFEWRKYANFVSVAIPKNKRRFSKARRFANMILKSYCIGVIIVPQGGDIDQQVVKPSINRHALKKHILDCLNEKQKTFAPAGSSGGYWTPYKETCRRMARMVKKDPGITMKDLIDRLDHHYANDASAKSSISHWAKAGKIKGVVCKKEGKFLRFYPEIN